MLCLKINSTDSLHDFFEFLVGNMNCDSLEGYVLHSICLVSVIKYFEKKKHKKELFMRAFCTDMEIWLYRTLLFNGNLLVCKEIFLVNVFEDYLSL